jgi:hypothetical protein
MSPDVFWIWVVWSVANAVLWCHAMWLYDKARRTNRRVLDLLDQAEGTVRDV